MNPTRADRQLPAPNLASLSVRHRRPGPQLYPRPSPSTPTWYSPAGPHRDDTPPACILWKPWLPQAIPEWCSSTLVRALETQTTTEAANTRTEGTVCPISFVKDVLVSATASLSGCATTSCRHCGGVPSFLPSHITPRPATHGRFCPAPPFTHCCTFTVLAWCATTSSTPRTGRERNRITATAVFHSGFLHSHPLPAP